MGREYFERANAILAAVEAAEAVIAQRSSEPRGPLKVTATPEFGAASSRYMDTKVRGFVDLAVKHFHGS